MGTFYYPLSVLPAHSDVPEDVEALLDCGSTYLWLPRPLMERLGYQPVVTRSFKLATGESISRGLSPVRVRIGNETWPLPSVFGDDGSVPLMGAMVLEAFSLAVDPVGKRLVPVPALAMGLG